MHQEDIRVRCTKCGNVHMESERTKRDEEELQKRNATALLCPECGHATALLCPECGHDTWEQA